MTATVKKPSSTYIAPSDSQMFRHGKAMLKQLAAGKGRQAAAAQAELARRAHNKSLKRQGRS